MKDATNYILSEIYRLLNGALTYDTTPVKVFSLEQEPSESDSLFVRFYSLTKTDNNTKTSFNGSTFINIDIINRLPGGERTEKKVNAVADSIGQILMPTPSTTGITSNSDFAVVYVKQGGPARVFSDRSNTDLIVRKILTFEVFTQQL